MDDAQDPYELEADAMGEDVQVKGAETKFDRKRNQETSPNIAATIKSLRMEEQNQLIAAMLQSLKNLQRQIKYGHQTTNTEGSRRNSRKKNVKLNQRRKGFKPSHSSKGNHHNL